MMTTSIRLMALFPFVVGAALLTTAAHGQKAVFAAENDPRRIMAAVSARSVPTKYSAELTMVVAGASGRERRRELVMRSMDFDTEKATKSMLVFSAPANVKGTALLSVDYDDGSMEDDQWIYLPSLRKATRIASGKKSGAFMGTDFSYSDMTRFDIADFEYEMKEQHVDINGEACWLILSRPVSEKAKEETGYVKSLMWVSKTKMMAVRIQAWVLKGRKVKYIDFADIREVDGYWISHRLTARTTKRRKTKSQTLLTYNNLKVGDPTVVPDDFSPHRLRAGLDP